MKVYYDKEYDTCAVEFDKDDGVDMSISEDGGIVITSFLGGKPEIIEKRLLLELE